MKAFRVCVLVVFVITLCFYCIFLWRSAREDDTIPTITVPEGILVVSFTADDTEFLRGITAYDEKDGDLSDRVFVESVSRFIEPGVSIVTYAVYDEDNHAASATRRVRYNGYTPPHFTMQRSLVFSLSDKVTILDCLGAVDVIDGDITGNIVLTSSDYRANTAGVFYISAKAANSKGDVIYIDLPIYVENESRAAPAIRLRDYIVYLAVGGSYDITANVVSAENANYEPVEVMIDTDLNTAVPGTYEVHYYATDEFGRRGHAILMVVVEEAA